MWQLVLITLTVRTLAHHDQVHVTAPAERAQEAVDVAADSAPVGRNTRGVNQHAGHLTGGHNDLLIRTATYEAKPTPATYREGAHAASRQGQFAKACPARWVTWAAT
jgi:hypothetical protein